MKTVSNAQALKEGFKHLDKAVYKNKKQNKNKPNRKQKENKITKENKKKT